MRIRWLGWAGVELENNGIRLLIDALGDPAAVFAALENEGSGASLPLVATPAVGDAAGAAVTHLHRDHADAALLAQALAPDASVLRPAPADGRPIENLGLAQAEAEFAAHGIRSTIVEPWDSIQIGPFLVMALPAVDGMGDPQVSWLVDDGEHRVLHAGDTIFHGYWWRIAQRLGPIDLAFLPINGAVVSFPHRQPASPLPAALTPDQAALAGELLGARAVVPMHYDGYEFDPYYRPDANAAERFVQAAAGRPYEVIRLEVGEETAPSRNGSTRRATASV